MDGRVPNVAAWQRNVAPQHNWKSSGQIIPVKHFTNSNQFVYIRYCCMRLLEPTELGRNS